eukprot:scaffold682_cov363-Pavlova_lutheri.AAC.5
MGKNTWNPLLLLVAASAWGWSAGRAQGNPGDAMDMPTNGTQRMGIVGPGESKLYLLRVEEASDVTVVVEPTPYAGVMGDVDLYCDRREFGTPGPRRATWSSERGSGFDVVFISRNDRLAIERGQYVCAVYGYSNFPVGYTIYAEVSPDTRELNVAQRAAAGRIYEECCDTEGNSNCLTWRGMGGSGFTDLCHYPKSMCDAQGNLVLLDLSREGLRCEFPIEDVLQFKQLHALILDFNSIEGEVGEIAEGLSQLEGFERLSMLRNSISGDLSSPGICALARSGLQALDLQANEITGSIPECLVGSQRIEEIKLASNQLTGSIPPDRAWPTYPVESRLRTLVLANNRIEGRFPSAISSLPSLVYVDITSNLLEGPLPQGFSAPFLQSALLAGNRLTGSIPENLAASSLLETLTLYDNNLSGSLPTNWSANLRRLDLGANEITGPVPPSLASHEHMAFLWLDRNQLSGELPGADIEAPFLNLRVFNVSENAISGNIPDSYSNMGVFTLPPSVTAGQILYSTFDVSSNRLSGEVPSFLQRFDPSRTPNIKLNGNRFVCPEETNILYLQDLDCAPSGEPAVSTSSDGETMETGNTSSSGLSGGDIAGIVISCIVVVALLAIGVYFVMQRKKQKASVNFVDLDDNVPGHQELALP